MKYIKAYELFGGAKITKKLKDDVIKAELGFNDLMLAIINQEYRKVKKIIKNGVDLEHQNNQGNTALLMAAKIGDLKIVKELIKNGANIHHKNKNGDDGLGIVV